MRTASRLVPFAWLVAACGDPADASPPDGAVGDAFAPDTVVADAAVVDTVAEVATACEPLPSTIPIGTAGAPTDTPTTAERRLVLMGGGAEVDEASRLFVQGANGGDVLVLRATGSVDSYTGYFGKVGATPAAASISGATSASGARACRRTVRRPPGPSAERAPGAWCSAHTPSRPRRAA